MALAPLDAPARRFHIARIDRVAQDVADALVGNLAVLGLGIERVLFKEAHDVSLGFQLARGVGFERLLDDRRLRLLPYQHPAIEAGDPAIGVAGRRAEHRKAIRDPRLHAVERLLAVVDAVIVRKRDGDVLHEARRRAVIEHACGRLQDCTELRQLAAEVCVIVEIAGEAVEMIEDDAVARLLVGSDEGEHLAQARPLALAAGQLVAEYLDDVITRAFAVIAQPRFL
nr:hypothetical protein [Methylobacterium dankookense]